MHAVLEELRKIGIIPVIKIDDADRAVPLARALVAGGIPCAEVTFRTAEGGEALRRISREVPDILPGAGTVLSTEQVDRAVDAGAKFIVSPGFNPKVVSYCVKKGIPVTPGCSTPSDIEQALEMGLTAVKIFPAEQLGGLDYIKALAAPYSSVRFIPTGGINAANIAAYAAYGRVLAVGGSWMVSSDLINAGDFDRISALSREAVMSLLGFELVHMGINAGSGEEALGAAALFSSLFGFAERNGNASVFAGESIEIMKIPGRGTHGHIAVGTNSAFRARAFLERRGILFDESTVKNGPDGLLKVVYFKEETGGFALHLVQK